MLNRRALLVGSVGLAAVATLPQISLAQSVKGGVFTHKGVAIRGADPVAYFTEGKPVIGSSEFAVMWNGATWHFSSATNRDAFIDNPDRYAPQYGGNCAFAVSKGYTASTVPEAWSIVDDKLYLNYSKGVRGRWERDTPGFIKAADTNWPKLANK